MTQQIVTQRQVAGIPQLGYGTWNRPGEQAYRGVLWALEAGYRHIDTAQGYGNEADVGRALRDSELARSEIFVTTKVAPENYGRSGHEKLARKPGQLTAGGRHRSAGAANFPEIGTSS